MLFQFENKDVQLVVNVLLSLALFGGVWAVDNQAAIVTMLAILIAYGLNLFAKTQHVHLGRGWLTIIVYLAALLMAFFLKPIALPVFTPETSDPALFVVSLMAYVPVLVAALSPYAGAAMAIYNVLLKDVLDRTTVGVLATVGEE